MAGVPFVAATMARRGLLRPGPPVRVLRQFAALHRWGFGLAGELRQAAAGDPGAGCGHRHRARPGDVPGNPRPLRKGGPGVARRPGDRVGVLRRNSAAVIETLIGVSQLGADPVLINTGLAPAQLGRLAEDQQLRTIVHDDSSPASRTASPDRGWTPWSTPRRGRTARWSR